MPSHKYLIALIVMFAMPLSALPFQGPGASGDAVEEEQKKLLAVDDLEVIRNRVIGDLLEPGVNEAEVRSMVATMRPNGSWPTINYEDVSRTGFQHVRHLHNVLDLGRAYRKPGSPLYHNEDVKKAAFVALDFWLAHDFISDNWWWNEMGTPNWMINILLVLDTDLTDRQRLGGLKIAGRANLEAFGARPGGDLIQIAGMLGKQALFRRDETTLERVVNVMANEITVTTGRGLQPDMSFHHRVDNVISTLSYGLGYASAFSYWAVKIRGTKFTFPETAVRLLIDYYLDGICKSMVYGKFPDPGAKNRDLSRKGNLRAAGIELPENLLKASAYRHDELQQIVGIRKGQIKSGRSFDRFFWQSEYFTHQRPGYFASVRMHSSRNHTVEEPHNEEGLKNHHLGDGSNFISLTGQEYFDIFPVWDWQKIPGTTAVQNPALPHWREIAKKGLTDFVGGVSDGQYGAAAFDFASPHDPLRARKAWFFFDDEFLCLGTAITSEADYPVYTTLNQCHLTSPVRVKTRKSEITLESGTHELAHVSWILQGGVGYLFPKARAASVRNEVATGTWREINHQAASSAGPVSASVFALWLDHGVKPLGGEYAYIVVPDATPSVLDEYVKDSPLEILSNTPAVQAVFHRKLNRIEMVFYEPGGIKVNGLLELHAESPCMAMVKLNGESIEALAVSDPSRKLSHVRLTTTALVDGSGPGWKSTWDKKEKISIIDVDLPVEGYAGKSVVITIPKIIE